MGQPSGLIGIVVGQASLPALPYRGHPACLAKIKASQTHKSAFKNRKSKIVKCDAPSRGPNREPSRLTAKQAKLREKVSSEITRLPARPFFTLYSRSGPIERERIMQFEKQNNELGGPTPLTKFTKAFHSPITSCFLSHAKPQRRKESMFQIFVSISVNQRFQPYSPALRVLPIFVVKFSHAPKICVFAPLRDHSLVCVKPNPDINKPCIYRALCSK